MKYSMSFGNLSPTPKPRPGGGATFGLAVLGDFSGRANKGQLETGAALASRKPRRVDVDNLDDILESKQLRLNLPVGDDGGAVEIEISSIDDFHPDELYEKVEVFADLALLRKRLQKSASFEAAAEEVRSWGPAATTAPRVRAKARGAAVPNAKLSDFARLMGAATATAEETPADELIKQIVRPYIKPDAAPDQAELVAAVDAAASTLMRRILHHPDFQTMESIWRSVDLLVRELETDTNLQVILYDISAEELAADLSSADDLAETGLYQLLVEKPEHDTLTTPPSAIVGCYTFEQTPPHAELLGRIAKIAAAATAPFLAGIGTEAFEKKKPEEIHPLVAESWGGLRSLPHAAYLGLTVPRFMLRWPYGAKTDSIDPFDFEEFTPQFGLKGFLWGNGAVLAGLLLGKTFTAGGMSGMKLGSVMNQGELPLYYYTDRDGDQIALPCTERLASEALATHLINQGFMPVLSLRGRPEVRLGGFGSVRGVQLAGPWAPVAIPAEGAAAEPEPPAPEPDESPDPEDSDEPVAVAPPADVAKDTLSGLLDDLDDMSDESEAEAAADEIAEDDDLGDDDSGDEDSSDEGSSDDDLDALLASIEGEGDSDEEDADSDEMDPDLAALLADL